MGPQKQATTGWLGLGFLFQATMTGFDTTCRTEGLVKLEQYGTEAILDGAALEDTLLQGIVMGDGPLRPHEDRGMCDYYEVAITGVRDSQELSLVVGVTLRAPADHIANGIAL